jgi:uncharacterized membrane protein
LSDLSLKLLEFIAYSSAGILLALNFKYHNPIFEPFLLFKCGIEKSILPLVLFFSRSIIKALQIFMGNLSKIGRIFYGIAMAGLGFLTIYYHDFPYMLLPPQNSPLPGLVILTYISGTLLFLAGACVVLEKKTTLISFLLGCVLLLIFCFLYIPYEFIVTSNFKHLVEWDNAEKELALAGGAFVIAGRYSEKNENPLNRFWGKLMPLGVILFSIPIISFGILHFLYANDASTLVPSWIPNPIFWTYLAGVALFGSGIAIILQIKPGIAATLLGTMVFIWFVILHIPRVMASPLADIGSEVTSAFLALAYSGIAFVIAGTAKKII